MTIDYQDIVTILRAANYGMTDKAADEIEALRAEVARLKGAKVGGDELLPSLSCIERMMQTLTKCGVSYGEGGVDAFYARLESNIYALCSAIDRAYEAKVGGVEREAMQAAWSKQTGEEWFNGAGITRKLWAAAWQARAALSADGGDAIAQKKAAFLKSEGAVDAGVMLRAGSRIAIVTDQGRVEWFDANEFGGIQLSADGGERKDAERPDMFWNNDDPEQVQGSIHDVVIEAYESGYDIGSTVEVQQAIRLENVKVQITRDETGEIAYEYIDAAIAAKAKGE